jgi:hypothetical protein
MKAIEPEEGDFFEGVLLETCRDDRVTRPRVRPVEMLPQWLRVEFPRHLREDNLIGTRGDKADRGTVTATHLRYVTINWDDGHQSFSGHNNDMRRVERVIARMS